MKFFPVERRLIELLSFNFIPTYAACLASRRIRISTPFKEFPTTDVTQKDVPQNYHQSVFLVSIPLVRVRSTALDFVQICICKIPLQFNEPDT